MEKMTKLQIADLVTDMVKGRGTARQYSAEDNSDVLREALIAANGGSSKIDVKAMRRNKYDIYEIIETIIPVIRDEALANDEFITQLVERIQTARGDLNEFVVEEGSNFIVAQMADGIATPRRQRIGERTTVTIPTYVHGVRIYDELSRFLAGRIDWNDLIAKVSDAVLNDMYTTVYSTFAAIDALTPGLNENYVKAGTYDEEALMEIVDHVEAATGEKAVILGTKRALRLADTAVLSNEYRSDRYHMGFYGKLNGVPMVEIRQRHVPGTDSFLFPNNVLYVVAANDMPVKLVEEGEPLIDDRDWTQNSDMTIEYRYFEKYGVGLIINQKLGKYTIT